MNKSTTYKIIFLIAILLNHLVITHTVGQEANRHMITPLMVGDEIPSELWDLPLKVVNHPDGHSVIKLKDYRDRKLIILEFWGTWCGSCISAFPTLKNLQRQFVDDIIVIPITKEKDDKVAKFILDNEIAKSVKLWSVVQDSSLSAWVTKYTYPHFTWISDGSVLSHSSVSAMEVSHVKAYLDSGVIRWDHKVNLNKGDVFFATLGDLAVSSSSFYVEGNLEGAGKGFGMLPFKGGRTNYYFINYSQRNIYEWFFKRLAREKGVNLQEIRYSIGFRNSPVWEAFNNMPVTMQIVASNEKPLMEVFEQWEAMSSFKLHQLENGEYMMDASLLKKLLPTK